MWNLLIKDKVVSLLNTSLFVFVDFKPEAFFRKGPTINIGLISRS